MPARRRSGPDWPAWVCGAEPLLREHHVADRVRIMEGSFIHDGPDDKAVEILKRVRSAAHDGATLLLVESVMPAHNREFIMNWFDLAMLIVHAGRERTAAEYQELLRHAGFHMNRVVPTVSPLSLIEAIAA